MISMGIESIGDVDDCLPIDGIGGWRISLQSVPNATGDGSEA